MSVGAFLRETRLATGLDQTALARRAGTTQTYISRVERGQVSPSFATLQRLLYAMGRRLVISAEPLPAGNVSPRELRAQLLDSTAAERVEDAIRLSEFLTGVSASATSERAAGDGR